MRYVAYSHRNAIETDPLISLVIQIGFIISAM